MFTIYALYNNKHKKIYIGQTTDIEKRIIEHNFHVLGGYISRYDDEWKIIYTENSPTREEALKREKQLKSFRGREFIKTHIPW